MGCREFLEGYSDFFDGRLEEPELSRFRTHLLICRRCAEYDRVLRRGLQIVRQLEPPAPSTELTSLFGPRLVSQQPARRAAGGRRTVGIAAGLAAAAVAFAVSVPALRARRVVELPPVVVERSVGNDLPSLWGPPPGASFLRAPDLSQYRSRFSPDQPYSLFRRRAPEVERADPAGATQTERIIGTERTAGE